VLIGNRKIPAFTRDLSNLGVYFYLSMTDSIPNDRDFEFLIEMPPDITLSAQCKIRCLGRVVRTEKASTDLTGIAAEILEYSMQRDATLA